MGELTCATSSLGVQLINRARECLLQSGDRGASVLLLGYHSQHRLSGGGRGGRHAAAGAHSSVSSTAAALSAPAWQVLLSRVGDALMLYLLVHTSIFAPLPNNCCLQLTGLPVSQVAQRMLPMPALVPSACTPNTRVAGAGKACVAAQLNALPTQQLQRTEVHARERPSSWHRRASHAPSAVAQPAAQPPARSIQAPRFPAAPVKPATWVLQRRSIFYCATFRSSAGLPAKHILSRLAGQQGAGQALFNAAMHPIRQHSRQPAACQRSLRKHRQLVGLLQQLADSVGTCLFGVLLQRHCPLPAKPQQQAGPLTAAAQLQQATVKLERLMDELYSLEQQLTVQNAGACMAPPSSNAAAPAPSASEPQALPILAQQPPLTPDEYNRQLASAYTPHSRVTAFVWAVLRQLLPPPLLGGSPHNQRVLRGALGRFVALRRFEHMTVHQAMQGMRTSDIAWLSPARAQKKQGDGSQQEPPAAGRAATGQAAAGHAAAGRAAHQGPPTEHRAGQRRLALWLHWLFGQLVIPLLRAHFYSTESEARGNEVVYYRKPVWAALARQAVAGLQQDQFVPVRYTHVLQLLQARTMGVARLRLLPKRTGIRFILNLSSASQLAVPPSVRQRLAAEGVRLPAGRLRFRPINHALHNLYQVLKCEASAQPHLLGSSVFGPNDMYTQLAPYLRARRAAAAAASSAPFHSQQAAPPPPGSMLVHAVSADVCRAFDHLNIPVLLQVVEPLLQHAAYHVVRYTEVFLHMGAVKVRRRSLARPAEAAGEPFSAHAERWAQQGANKLFVDQVAADVLTRDQALQLLRQHLTASIVKLQRRWCYQARGIAQGSTLSSLLCSLYLAHVERAHLAPLLACTPPQHPLCELAAGADQRGNAASGGQLTALAQAARSSALAARYDAADPLLAGVPAHALVRLVDDFLLLSSNAQAAHAVAGRLVQGFSDIYVNSAKTKVTFQLRLPDGRLIPSNLHVEADGAAFIRWCGLLVNTRTLEFQADYTRYAAMDLTSTLTLPLHKRPATLLANRLCVYLRPKMHPLLLDGTINSHETVCLNIYQAFLVGAAKLACYLRAMPVQPPCELVRAAIEAGVACMCYLARKRRVASQVQARGTLMCSPGVTSLEIRWLAFQAFLQVLRRRQARYRQLNAWLAQEAAAPQFSSIRTRLVRRLKATHGFLPF